MLDGTSAAFASAHGEERARGWYHPGMTRVHIELHASDLESEGSRSNPTTPETNVNVHVRVLPAFSAQSQIHLAPARHDEADAEENEGRPEPASLIPMTTASISSDRSQVRVR